MAKKGERLTAIRRKIQQAGLEDHIWVRCDGPCAYEIERMGSSPSGAIVRFKTETYQGYESNLYLTDREDIQPIILNPERLTLLPRIRPEAKVRKYGVSNFAP